MLEKVPAAVGHALSAVRPGLEKLICADDSVSAPESIIVESTAFGEGEPIPARYTEDGEGLSPPLAWTNVPERAGSVILVIEDADSPTPAPFVHALVFGLPGGDTDLPAGALPGKAGPGTIPTLGKNTFRKARYLPPDPPTGHGPHRYVFQVYALEGASTLDGEPEKHDIVEALKGRVAARGQLIGAYERRG